MAKRKRRPGNRKGFKLRLEKDYRDERYVMYVVSVETGILQVSTIDSNLTDGDVIDALEDLILQLQNPEVFANVLFPQSAGAAPAADAGEEKIMGRTQNFILMNLRSAFEQHGALPAEDVVGILDVIKRSTRKHSVGMHRRGYLTFLVGFLGQMGIEVRQLSDEEVEEMGLEVIPPDYEEGAE